MSFEWKVKKVDYADLLVFSRLRSGTTKGATMLSGGNSTYIDPKRLSDVIEAMFEFSITGKDTDINGISILVKSGGLRELYTLQGIMWFEDQHIDDILEALLGALDD